MTSEIKFILTCRPVFSVICEHRQEINEKIKNLRNRTTNWHEDNKITMKKKDQPQPHFHSEARQLSLAFEWTKGQATKPGLGLFPRDIINITLSNLIFFVCNFSLFFALQLEPRTEVQRMQFDNNITIAETSTIQAPVVTGENSLNCWTAQWVLVVFTHWMALSILWTTGTRLVGIKMKDPGH